MFFGFAIIIAILGVFMLAERIYPDRKLVSVTNWWEAVIVVNLTQLFVVVGTLFLERYLVMETRLNLASKVSPFVGGLIAYVCHTWVMYWWHYFRHENYLLWRLLHQFHHSAQRIETITSFYKHPLEIMTNSIIMTILLYPILGLNSESSIWLSIFSAISEFFYHANIKTPQWIGYFFQRPESHRIHHAANRRIGCNNYGDLPIWDILNNTFTNPQKTTIKTGFSAETEGKRLDMLMVRDVLDSKKRIIITKIDIMALILLIIGCLNIVGYLCFSPNIQGLAFVTASSPLPLVFSAYKGVETFSFEYQPILINNETQLDLLDIYNQIAGPYNRRNVFGAMFSYGPLFDDPNLIKLRDEILNWAICKQKLGWEIFITLPDILFAEIEIKSKTVGFENRTWSLRIDC